MPRWFVGKKGGETPGGSPKSLREQAKAMGIEIHPPRDLVIARNVFAVATALTQIAIHQIEKKREEAFGESRDTKKAFESAEGTVHREWITRIKPDKPGEKEEVLEPAKVKVQPTPDSPAEEVYMNEAHYQGLKYASRIQTRLLNGSAELEHARSLIAMAKEKAGEGDPRLLNALVEYGTDQWRLIADSEFHQTAVGLSETPWHIAERVLSATDNPDDPTLAAAKDRQLHFLRQVAHVAAPLSGTVIKELPFGRIASMLFSEIKEGLSESPALVFGDLKIVLHDIQGQAPDPKVNQGKFSLLAEQYLGIKLDSPEQLNALANAVATQLFLNEYRQVSFDSADGKPNVSEQYANMVRIASLCGFLDSKQGPQDSLINSADPSDGAQVTSELTRNQTGSRR